MDPRTLLAGVAIAVSVVLALQGVTFTYVVSIEHRLTRLETLQETRTAGELQHRAQRQVAPAPAAAGS